MSSTRKPAPVSSHSLSHSPPNLGNHQSTFCPPGQFWTPHASAILLQVGFHVWLLSLSMMLSRVFPAGAWISASFFFLVEHMSIVRTILPLVVLVSQGHVCRSTAALGGLHLPWQTRPDPIHLCPYLRAKMLAFMGCLFL